MLLLPEPEAGLVMPFCRGKLRARGFVLTFAIGAAMVTLVGWPGVLIAVALGGLQIYRLPPRVGVWRFSAQELQRARWLDQHSVVLGGSYRSFGQTIYRDEVTPEQFCRLRRRCYGLPD